MNDLRCLWIGTGPAQYALDSPLAQSAMMALDAIPATELYLGYIKVDLCLSRRALFSHWKEEWRLDFLGTEEDCLAFWPMRNYPNEVQLALLTTAALGKSKEAKKAQQEVQKLLADEQAKKQAVLEGV